MVALPDRADLAKVDSRDCMRIVELNSDPWDTAYRLDPWDSQASDMEPSAADNTQAVAPFQAAVAVQEPKRVSISIHP